MATLDKRNERTSSAKEKKIHNDSQHIDGMFQSECQWDCLHTVKQTLGYLNDFGYQL